jgi:hypothetical protein
MWSEFRYLPVTIQLLRFRDRPILYQIPVPCQGPERDSKTDARVSGIGQATSWVYLQESCLPPSFVMVFPQIAGETSY